MCTTVAGVKGNRQSMVVVPYESRLECIGPLRVHGASCVRCCFWLGGRGREGGYLVLP